MTPDELEAIKEAHKMVQKHFNKMGFTDDGPNPVNELIAEVESAWAEIEHLQQYKEFHDSIPALPIVTCPECGNHQFETGGPMLCAGCEKHFLSDEWMAKL